MRIRAIAWKPKSSLFALGTSNSFIYLYDYDGLPRDEGAKLNDRGIPAHDSHLRGLSWSPDGKRLASASGDRTVRLWDLDANSLEEIEKKKVLTIPHDSEVRAVAWHEGGRLLASLTDKGVVTIFDATLGYERAKFLDERPDLIDFKKP